MDNSVRNLIVASIVLILTSMYGGDTLSSWFVMKGEAETDDVSYEGTEKYYLTEAKAELEFSGADTPDDESYDVDYDDSSCSYSGGKCDELISLMVNKIQNLLYIAILAGFAALYFLNENDVEKGKMACLAMGGAGLLAVIMFGLLFPEVLEDDTETWQRSEGSTGIDLDPSIAGGENFIEDDVSWDISWRPDFAFLLVALSGILGMVAYGGIDSEASSNLSNQNEYQDNPFNTPSMPSIPTLEDTPATPNPYQVQCGNCQMMIDGNVEYCPNCGFQKI